jgi:signal peptidase I
MMRFKIMFIIVISVLFVFSVLGVDIHTPRGVSMEPTIIEGDRLLSIRPFNCSVGDIIIFVSPAGKVIAHRIIWQGEGWLTNTEIAKFYRTAGDNNYIADRYIISERDVKCKIIFIF